MISLKKLFAVLSACLIAYLFLTSRSSDISRFPSFQSVREFGSGTRQNNISVNDIPPFSGYPYVVLNNNKPSFSEEDFERETYEFYSPLDELGRCGVASANICRELMPVKKRESIGMIKPSGWQTVKYDFVDGKYMYNRCHLIGFQLTGENANEKNLITGTRYMNIEGMLSFENMVADYVKETGGHVLYRATPVFQGTNLVASGVQIEAASVEDEGKSLSFNVYCYNVQPGVDIDYATGKTNLAGARSTGKDNAKSDSAEEYILNVNGYVFRVPLPGTLK